MMNRKHRLNPARRLAGFFLSALLLLASSAAALAQSGGEVANHAVAIGKGPGVIGWGAAAPGAAGTLLTSTGATTDPAFGGAATISGTLTLTNGTINSTVPIQLLNGAAAQAIMTGCILVSSTYSSCAVTGLVDAGLGFRINGAAANGNYLRGNGTNYIAQPAATAAQYVAGSAGGAIEPTTIYPGEGVLTFSSTITLDFSTFINANVTMTGNITTQTLTNVTAGKSGMITFIQDGTGSRTSVFNTVFKFPGGSVPVLSTAANAIDVLSYSCRSATSCPASLLKDVR